MVNKLFCVLMLFFSFSLFAQNANNVKSNTKNSTSKDDAFSESRQENVLRQPLAWESMGDITKYEILIERFDEEKNRYVRHLLHITNEEETQRCKIYISPILSPGKYRATITPFNILGQKAVSFAFNHEFTVSAAHAPTLEEVLFDKSNANILYLDLEGENAIFEIRGKNLLPPVKDGDEVWYTTYSLRRGKTIVYCPTMISHSSDNTSIRLQVPTSKLGQGKYHLHAQDASGLYSENDICVF
ncbi:MAG: hypothetical protein IJR49_01385, partial [Treponema sp.]|nr:hypothetical protein [Treponema sp.]